MSPTSRKLLIASAVGIALFILGSVWWRYYDERSGAAIRLAGNALEEKQRIAQAAEKSGTLVGSGASAGISTATGPSSSASQQMVDANGVIRGTTSYGDVLVFTPELKAGKVEWQCKSDQQTYTRAACRLFLSLGSNR